MDTCRLHVVRIATISSQQTKELVEDSDDSTQHPLVDLNASHRMGGDGMGLSKKRAETTLSYGLRSGSRAALASSTS